MADRPQFNGLAERSLGLIETTVVYGRIQASHSFTGAQLLASASLWAEASYWTCNALNRTSTTAIPETKPPNEMWHGRPLGRTSSFRLATAR